MTPPLPPSVSFTAPAIAAADALGRRRSNREDLLLLRVSDLVTNQDVAVGELLELGLDALHLIGGHTGALLLRFQLVMRMAAERTNFDAALLDLLVELLHQLLAALLIECRDVQADDRTVVT